MADLIDLKFSRYTPGTCQKCGRQTDDMYLATITREGVTKRHALCKECSAAFQSSVNKKNAEAAAAEAGSGDVFGTQQNYTRSAPVSNQQYAPVNQQQYPPQGNYQQPYPPQGNYQQPYDPNMPPYDPNMPPYDPDMDAVPQKKKMSVGCIVGLCIAPVLLVIVIALVAVMAPAFVKYTKSSRDVTMTNAAESMVEYLKSEYAVGDIAGDGTVTVYADSDDQIIAEASGIYFTYDGDLAGRSMDDLVDLAGITGSSSSDLVITITITQNYDGNFSFVTATDRSD